MEFIGACLLPLFAIFLILGGLFSFWAFLDILTGVEPGSEESLLYPLFQEGAIFGPSKKNN